MVLPVATALAVLAQQPTADAAGAKPKASASASASASAATPLVATATAPGAAPSASAAPATPPSATASPSPSPMAPSMDGQTYAVRLRALEERVDALKDQIRRSHTRLALLSDTIIGGASSGSRAEIEYVNEMSSAFSLRRVVFVLDGQIQYSRADETGALADQKEIPIYSGSLPPGDHTLSVLLEFQGNGYGVFSYLRGYKFNLKNSHSFTAVEGKTLSITASSYEQGGVTTPLEQRPAIVWHEKVQPIGGGAALSAPAPAGSGAPPAGGGSK